MADEQLNKEDDSIYARKEYSATPYEVFQADSPRYVPTQSGLSDPLRC